MNPRESRIVLFIVITLLGLPCSNANDLPKTLSAREMLSFPLVGGRANLPAYSAGDAGEGVPTSFDICKEEGYISILVPHARAILRWSSSGEFLHRIDLLKDDGSPLPERTFLFDLAISPSGGWFVLDKTGGWVIHFSSDGLVKDTFGHFVDPDRMEIAPDLNIVVSDRGLGLINEFDPKGTFLADIRDPHVWPLRTADGRFVRTRVVGDRRGFIWLRGSGRQLGRLMGLIESPRDHATLYHVAPLGFDQFDRLYILTVEGIAEDYSSHVFRFDGHGNIEAVFQIDPNLERLAQIPRFFRLTDDGTLYGFFLRNGHYHLVSYATGS